MRPWSNGEWRKSLSKVVETRAELDQLIASGAGVETTESSAAAARAFPLKVPRLWADRAERGDCPPQLLRQFVPHPDETLEAPGYGLDPLDEESAAPVPGLLHKYEGRVLLMVTGACAVHCRYCFRRHFPYPEHRLSEPRLRAILDYLRQHESVHEVILSGGDPLVATDHQLSELVARLSSIPHLTSLRVHTRLPIVLPERVDDHLLEWLAGSRLAPVMVVHSNHAAEIDERVAIALGELRRHHVPLFNQAVLLRGVNDSLAAQRELWTTLFSCGVVPYYLHLLDPVAGAAHFAVSLPVAQRLMLELAASLPGYLVPRLVAEQPGAPAKTWMAAAAS